MNQVIIRPNNPADRVVYNGYSKSSTANYITTNSSDPASMAEITKNNVIRVPNVMEAYYKIFPSKDTSI